jgi:hypothetical protein
LGHSEKEFSDSNLGRGTETGLQGRNTAPGMLVRLMDFNCVVVLNVYGCLALSSSREWILINCTA